MISFNEIMAQARTLGDDEEHRNMEIPVLKCASFAFW